MEHEFYMRRCLQLAKNGLGTTFPNPFVGAVIVYKNRIIGEGFTSAYGGNHAEVNAINAVKDKSCLPQSTLYVSLEPCSHFGNTPPCSDLIIKHKIPNVVIGCVDDNTLVAGRGIEKLKVAGVAVILGVLEKECKAQHKRFFTFHNKKRPYIFLKWAQSGNGFISPNTKADHDRKPVWISNNFAKQLVHKQRAQEQAILVGTNTAIADNPKLNTRLWHGSNCLRVVIDLHHKIPEDSHIFKGKQPTLLFSKTKFAGRTQIETVIVKNEKELVHEICKELYERKIQSLIIEGGSYTLQQFINANLWDEAYVYSAPNLHLADGVKAPVLKGNPSITETKLIKNNLLTKYLND